MTKTNIQVYCTRIGSSRQCKVHFSTSEDCCLHLALYKYAYSFIETNRLLALQTTFTLSDNSFLTTGRGVTGHWCFCSDRVLNIIFSLPAFLKIRSLCYSATIIARPPGIPVREFSGIPGNPPRQKFPAGIPGNYWVFGENFWEFIKCPILVIYCCELWKLADMKTYFSPFYEFKSLKFLDLGTS